MTVKDLKKASHAPHLLVNVFLQVLVSYYTSRHFFLLLCFVFWLGFWHCYVTLYRCGFVLIAKLSPCFFFCYHSPTTVSLLML